MKITYLLLFLTIGMHGFSQENEQNMNDYKNLSKDSLVQIAINQLKPIIEKKGGSFSKIDFKMYKTQVKSNGESIMVRFNVPIKYLPIKSSYYGNMVVDIKKNFYHIQKVSNPKEDNYKPVFYLKSPSDNENVVFVKNAVSREGTVGTIFNDDFFEEVIIRETKKYYKVSSQSMYQHSSFKVLKGSGEIIEIEHESLDPGEEDEDDYVEIN